MSRTYRIHAQPAKPDASLWELFVDLVQGGDVLPQLFGRDVPPKEIADLKAVFNRDSSIVQIFILPGAAPEAAAQLAAEQGGSLVTSGPDFDRANSILNPASQS